MTSLTVYLDRALLHRCVVCERKLSGATYWVGSGTVTEWDRDKGECTQDVEMHVCSEECLGLFEAGERVPA